MKKVEFYLADDGKKFYDEDECREYEVNQRLDKIRDDFYFYDHAKRKISVGIESFDSVYYIVCYNTDSLNKLHEIMSDCDQLGPEAKEGAVVPGMYYYSEHYDKWVCFEDELEKLKEFGRMFGLEVE